MRSFFTAIVLLCACILQAQNFENSWTGHFSYANINSISQGNDKIYAASDNALFSFDLSTQEIETISTVNGLSGELIATSLYSEATNLLVIGYENGLMEIIRDGEEDVLTIVDIVDSQTVTPDRKRINHFTEFDGNLYISTGFGIVVYDLETLEFGDTYLIGDLGTALNITQTAIVPPLIYAASNEGGIRVADVNNPNIINFNEWNTLILGNYKGVQPLNNEIYVLRDDDAIFNYNIGSGFTLVKQFESNVLSFITNDNVLSISSFTRVEAYTGNFTLVAQVGFIPDFSYISNTAIAFNETFYIGTTEIGMLTVPFGTNTASQQLPNGPIANTPFSLGSSPGQLWVNYGDVDVTFNPFPLTRRGISNLREGQWTNIPFEELLDANDLVNIAINPNNPNEVYMSSFNKGLLKIEDQTPSILINSSNSALDPSVDGQGNLDVRIYGSDFDRQGNLWFVQSRVDNGLIQLSPEGQLQLVNITSVISNPSQELALSELAVSREGIVFFDAVQSGLIGYNPQNGVFNIIGDGEGNGNLPNTDIRALTFDLQNRLWIGTREGLRVLFNVGGFFDEGTDVEAQPIIILDDGVPQELLESQTITAIQVDGSNNKWVATSTSGVFYLSPNGQETLLRFTEENSPLPTNNVQDIAIDSFTGEVYFGTLNGLVSFNGSATAPRENLDEVYAFPNPVRPGFTGNVTIDGLTANANVKITDIEGNLVFEQTSRGGSVLWDTTAFGRYKVRSGVYLVIITSEDQIDTAVQKIMVVR